jgi:plastocyanin
MQKYKTRTVSSLALAMLCMCLSLYTLIFPPIVQAAGEAVTIQILGSTQPPGFFPALLTVHVYDTVIFNNQASPTSRFSIVADDGTFSSPTIAPGKQWIVTFNTPGEHEYHTSTNVPRMVGVIIVVPNSVSLLATPAPGTEATVLALIKAGKTPPDTLIVPSPTPVPTHTQSALATSPFGSWLLPALFIAGAIIALLGLSTGSFYLFRFLRRRLRKRGKNDDDNDDEEDEDDD